MIRAGLFATWLALAVTATAQAKPLPPEAVTALNAGRPWVSVTLDAGGEAALIRAAIDIPAPAERIWKLMTDCRYAARMVTSLTNCRVLSRGEGWDIREHVTRGGPLLPTLRNVFRSDYEPYRRIRFHRVDGDLKTMEGEWGLSPLGAGKVTRVTYENRLAARILAPALMVRASLRKDTPKMLENLRRLVTGG